MNLDKDFRALMPKLTKGCELTGYNEGKTAMKMRDNRIYRNAVKGGIVQQNMIKSGYIPE